MPAKDVVNAHVLENVLLDGIKLYDQPVASGFATLILTWAKDTNRTWSDVKIALVINLGLPKTGSTSLHAFLKCKCGGVRSSNGNCGEKKCGVCISRI